MQNQNTETENSLQSFPYSMLIHRPPGFILPLFPESISSHPSYYELYNITKCMVRTKSAPNIHFFDKSSAKLFRYYRDIIRNFYCIVRAGIGLGFLGRLCALSILLVICILVAVFRCFWCIGWCFG